MLARALPGASVLVCADRYLAGRLAEHQFDASVHVLDDGFQHLQLDRDVDIVMIGKDDVARPATLPSGRLREPLDTIVAADAIIAADDEVAVDTMGVEAAFFRTRSDPPLATTASARRRSISTSRTGSTTATASIPRP